MEFLEVIKKRRSCRSYNNKSVSDEIIKEIIASGIYAPSAVNKQPWELVVIKDQAIKSSVAEMFMNKGKELGKGERYTKTYNVINEAPVLVLIFNNDPSRLIYNEQSNAAFIENMLLTATYYEVNSLWIGLLEVIKDELAVKFNKEGKLLTAAVALGYSNETIEMPKRKNIEEFVEWM